MSRTFCTVYWWPTAWLPSRSVTSEMKSLSLVGSNMSGRLLCLRAQGDRFGGAHRRGGHDVEIAGVGGQVVGRALHLKEDARLQARELADAGDDDRLVDEVELHLLLEAVAGHVGVDLGDHLLDGGLDCRLIAALRQGEDRVAHH